MGFVMVEGVGVTQQIRRSNEGEGEIILVWLEISLDNKRYFPTLNYLNISAGKLVSPQNG